MQHPQYSDLCRAVSRELAQADVEALARDGYTVVDGIAIGVCRGPTSHSLKLAIDLGEVGDDGRLFILEEVLHINFALDGPEEGLVGLDEETDHLVLTRTVSWDDDAPDAHGAADLLRRCAAFSNDFRARMQAAIATGGVAPIDWNVAMTKV